MNTSVYISDQRIQVLLGKVKAKKHIDIKSCMYVSLPDNAVINGQVNNELVVKEALQRLWDKYDIPKKDVCLVIGSSTILNKKIEVPVLPEKSINLLVQEEFKDVDGVMNLLFDYLVMDDGKNGNAKILSNAINKELVGGYIRIFRALDINLKTIETSISTEFKVFNKILKMKDKDCIVIILDGNNMNSILHKNGCYIYSTRNVLREERGSQDLASEIATNTSPLIQFAKTDGDRKNITNVFICGATEGEEELCTELSNLMGVKVDIVPTCSDITYQGNIQTAQCLLSDYIYNVGNLIRL